MALKVLEVDQDIVGNDKPQEESQTTEVFIKFLLSRNLFSLTEQAFGLIWGLDKN